jgi:hypothetical protein
MGTLGDAESIVRKLIEVAITLKFLATAPDELIVKYLEFEKIDRYNKLQEVRKRKAYEQIREGWESNAALIEQHYESLKEKYSVKKGEIKNEPMKFWSGLSLGRMADDCGLGKLYAYPYKIFCSSVHCSVEEIPKYFDIGSDTVGPAVSMADVQSVLLSCCNVHLINCKVLSECCELPLLDAITDTAARLKVIADEVPLEIYFYDDY